MIKRIWSFILAVGVACLLILLAAGVAVGMAYGKPVADLKVTGESSAKRGECAAHANFAYFVVKQKADGRTPTEASSAVMARLIANGVPLTVMPKVDSLIADLWLFEGTPAQAAQEMFTACMQDKQQ